MGTVRVWKEMSLMPPREGEHAEEAIMSQLTAGGGESGIRCCPFFNEMSKTLLTPVCTLMLQEEGGSDVV